MKHQADWRQRT